MSAPFKKEASMGVNEKFMHAQMVIKYYSDGLTDAGCLARAPMQLYVEVDHSIEHINDLQTAVTGVNHNQFSPEKIKPSEEESVYNHIDNNNSNTEAKDRSEVEKIVMSRMYDNCINCPVEAPDLSAELAQLSGALDDALNLVADISLWFDLFDPFKNINTDMCSLVYLFLYQCIPDLIKILAAILARIAILMAPLNLGSFTLMFFINGIIGAILKALLSAVLKITDAVFEPLQCVIDSLLAISSKLPTEQNIRENLTYQFRNSEAASSVLDSVASAAPAVNTDELLEQYRDHLSNQRQEITGDVKDVFKDIGEVFQETLDSLMAEVKALFATFLHVDCENERTGNNITEKLQAVSELIMMANIIRSIISNKGKAEAIKELCSGSDSFPVFKSDGTVTEVSEEFFVKVIEDAFSATAEIVESDAGDLAVLLTKKKKDVLGMPSEIFECTLGDFMQNADIVSVVKESVEFANETILNASGADPMTILFPRRERIPSSNLPFNPEYQSLITLRSGEADIASDYNAIMEDILTTNFVSGRREKVPNLYEVVAESKVVSGVEAVTHLQAVTEEQAELNTIASGDSGVRATTIKNIAISTEEVIPLQCGSMDSIMKRFESING